MSRSSTIRLNAYECEEVAYSLANSPSGPGVNKVKMTVIEKVQRLTDQLKRPEKKGNNGSKQRG